MSDQDDGGRGGPLDIGDRYVDPFAGPPGGKVKPWQRPGWVAYLVAAVVVAAVVAFILVYSAADEPADRQAVEATCAGTDPVREAIAKRDMAGITSSTRRMAADAAKTGESSIVEVAQDVVREGKALVNVDESPDFYKAHLAAMEADLSTIDTRCVASRATTDP